MNLHTIWFIVFIEVADTALKCRETVVLSRSLAPCVIYDSSCTTVSPNGKPSSRCITHVVLTRKCKQLSNCDNGSDGGANSSSMDRGGTGEGGGEVMNGTAGGRNRGSGTGTRSSGGPVGTGKVVGGRIQADLVGMPKELNSTSIRAIPEGEPKTGSKWKIGVIVVAVLVLLGMGLTALTCWKMRNRNQMVASPLVDDEDGMEMMQVVGPDGEMDPGQQPPDSQSVARPTARPTSTKVISNYQLRSQCKSLC